MEIHQSLQIESNKVNSGRHEPLLYLIYMRNEQCIEKRNITDVMNYIEHFDENTVYAIHGIVDEDYNGYNVYICEL